MMQPNKVCNSTTQAKPNQLLVQGKLGSVSSLSFCRLTSSMLEIMKLITFCCSMDECESLAQRNAMLVHGLDRKAQFMRCLDLESLQTSWTQNTIIENFTFCWSMDEWESLAQRNAMLVHGLDWNERRAGIFEPAPTDELAVATTLGLVLNCLSSGLYMVSPNTAWQYLKCHVDAKCKPKHEASH